jgi:hypothetical protein
MRKLCGAVLLLLLIHSAMSTAIAGRPYATSRELQMHACMMSALEHHVMCKALPAKELLQLMHKHFNGFFRVVAL